MGVYLGGADGRLVPRMLLFGAPLVGALHVARPVHADVRADPSHAASLKRLLVELAPAWADRAGDFVCKELSGGLTNVVMLNMFANWDLSVEPPAFFASGGLSLGWMDAFNIDLTGVAVLLDRILEACGEQCTQAFLKRMRDDFVSAVEGMPFSTVYLTLTAVLPLLISFFVLLMYRNFFQVVWLFLFILIQ